MSKVIHVSTIISMQLYSHAKANASLYFVIALLGYIDIFLEINIMKNRSMFVSVCGPGTINN